MTYIYDIVRLCLWIIPVILQTISFFIYFCKWSNSFVNDKRWDCNSHFFGLVHDSFSGGLDWWFLEIMTFAGVAFLGFLLGTFWPVWVFMAILYGILNFVRYIKRKDSNSLRNRQTVSGR